MTVRELIEALQKLPPDADVYYNDGPHEGMNTAFETEPSPHLQDYNDPHYPHGRVIL